ncbi:glycoside hydrolase family 66 protein [Clostridium chromiireducens]|nr:glycoside hydrolase family 66 protein [Clostridium chromiireducens]
MLLIPIYLSTTDNSFLELITKYEKYLIIRMKGCIVVKKERKKLKVIQSVLLALTVTMSSAFIEGIPVSAASSTTGKMIRDLNTDKAMYNPGDKVTIYMDVTNNSGKDVTNGKVTFNFKHLEKDVSLSQTVSYSAKTGGTTSTPVVCNWTVPNDNFKGYLVQAICKDENGIVLDTETVGVDVSSGWTKFPRYGYLTKFEEHTDTRNAIWTLKNYHINGLQYYDAQYRHHKPASDNTEVWDDWAGRKIYGNTIRSYISSAKQANMVNMQYNMIYAATSNSTNGSNYWDDGVHEDWGLWYSENNSNVDKRGQRFTFFMSDTPTGDSTLYFFNPWNKGWQDYILAQENKSLNALGYDGWHGDTVGEWGEMKTADGHYVYVKDTYTDFLNAAKQALGNKYVMMNPVGAQGIENVNKSNVDVLYTEIWPWDRDSEGVQYSTYSALKKEVEQSRKESNGKSLIVPAYMQKDYGIAHPGSYFNTGAVILTDAAIYSAGGSRLELGDNGKMLNHEYFPAENLKMNDELVGRERNMYDFIVAYENLLRDGQSETNNGVYVYDRQASRNDDAGSIWYNTKIDSKYQIIQMVNLIGVNNNEWRNDDYSDKIPDTQTNVKVKYYYTGDVNSVYVASPDPAYNCETRSLKIEKKSSDDAGNYIEFTVPTLEYWDMIYMTGDEPDGGDELGNNSRLINSGFESGDLNGWTATGTNVGVDNNDAQEGNYKCYFWSNEAYNQKIEQTLSGLENGIYTIKAKVKQNTGNSILSRMELTEFGGGAVYTDIPHGDLYVEITGTAQVTNGKLNIAFYQAAPGNTNLEIDNVTLILE